jgi:peroxiredoxin (alkyl hydroperoxide reductase subunit C)
MSLVTKPAPDFQAKAVLADGSIVENFRLSGFQGKYVVLFFYPMDFTFVCPTEILAFNDQLDEFKKRNVEVIGVSVDNPHVHWAWRETTVEKGGIGRIGYPLVADLSKKIARDYGVLLNEEVALRGLFLIDRKGIVRHELVNDLPLGRSIDEAIRMVDALQTFEEFGEVCPANFRKGSTTMKADHEGVSVYLSARK